MEQGYFFSEGSKLPSRIESQFKVLDYGRKTHREFHRKSQFKYNMGQFKISSKKKTSSKPDEKSR
jgi:hypothetical protein